MRQIIWTNFAISELKNIYLYYRIAAGDKVADKIRKSIFDATRRLAKQPLMGAVEENLSELRQTHRYLISGNYKIIYRVINDDVYITDIFDSRQDPQKTRERGSL